MILAGEIKDGEKVADSVGKQGLPSMASSPLRRRKCINSACCRAFEFVGADLRRLAPLCQTYAVRRGLRRGGPCRPLASPPAWRAGRAPQRSREDPPTKGRRRARPGSVTSRALNRESRGRYAARVSCSTTPLRWGGSSAACLRCPPGSPRSGLASGAQGPPLPQTSTTAYV